MMKNTNITFPNVFSLCDGGCRLFYKDKAGQERSFYLGKGYKTALQDGIIVDLDGSKSGGANYSEVLHTADDEYDNKAIKSVVTSILFCFKEKWTNNYLVRSQDFDALAIFLGCYIGMANAAPSFPSIEFVLEQMRILKYPLPFNLDKFRRIVPAFFEYMGGPVMNQKGLKA